MPISEAKSTPPVAVLREGDTGRDVELIQRKLNRISANFPGIPKIYPQDGFFGSSTTDAVRKFQEVFDLTVDGIVESKSTFSLSDVWGSSIYYKQAIVGEGQGKLVIQDVNLDPALTYVWKYDAKYGMKATAYVGGKNYPSQSWVVTPAIDLGRAKNPQLSFDQARKYGVDFLKECFVMASTDYAGDVTTCNWDTIPYNQDEEGNFLVPDGSSWNFMSTGEMDLSKYVGQKVYIGFQYNSSELGSATWEFKNLLVSEPQE